MVQVRHNTAKHRFEVFDDDDLAGFVEYHQDGNTRTFTHTEIRDGFEGRGLGSKLAATALDQTWESGERIVAECPFIRDYMARHPERNQSDRSG